MASGTDLDLAGWRIWRVRSGHQRDIHRRENPARSDFRDASEDLFIPENCDAPIAANVDFATDGGTTISAAFDFRHTGVQTWDIDIETDEGAMKLADGGNALFIGGRRVPIATSESEYASLYRRFEHLVRNNASDVDATPFRLVADAFLVGKRVTVERFDE